MTIRSDLSIDWEVSPRIITVAAPSTEITMQDLLDTLRTEESKPANADDDFIVDAAGKENLGGGVKVGLTVTLQNAQLAFEARSGPNYIQCNVTGGNLVSVDSDGNDLSPIHPTAFTQIVLANSSSATLQEQTSIQYSSFNGGVSYDTTSPYTGTDFPVGTPQQPVNNVYDAYGIAIKYGFTTGYVLSDLTVPTDLPLAGFTFIGAGKDRTVITIPDAASVSGCTYIDAEITGYLDGSNTLRDCLIKDLHYIKGYLEECVLANGTIVLAGSEEAHFLDCYSGVPGTGTPTIDMGVSGQSLALRNYNGGIKLINKSGPESVSIDLNSGQIKLDSTITNGDIVCRGVGKVIDADTGDYIKSGNWYGANILNEVISLDTISISVWDEDMKKHINDATTGHALMHQTYNGTVYIDPINGTDGTDFPYGIIHEPVKNMDSVLSLYHKHGLSKVHILGSLTISGGIDISGLTFTSDRSIGNSLNIVSAITSGTYFDNLTVSGVGNGLVRFSYCVINGFTNLSGGIKNSLIVDNLQFVSGTNNYMTDCDRFMTSAADPYIDIDIDDSDFNMIRCRGNYNIKGKKSSGLSALDLNGTIRVDSTCVSGFIVVGGLTRVIDYSGPNCTVLDATLTNSNITDAVWNEMLSAHASGSGSMAETLDKINKNAGLIPATV